MLLVVHRGSGTILDASECVLVDTDLTDEGDILDLADAEGTRIAG